MPAFFCVIRSRSSSGGLWPYSVHRFYRNSHTVVCLFVHCSCSTQ